MVETNYSQTNRIVVAISAIFVFADLVIYLLATAPTMNSVILEPWHFVVINFVIMFLIMICLVMNPEWCK